MGTYGDEEEGKDRHTKDTRWRDGKSLAPKGTAELQGTNLQIFLSEKDKHSNDVGQNFLQFVLKCIPN